MPFRDDLQAATLRRDALARELAAVEQRLSDHEPLQQKAQELRHQLEDAKRRLELPLLTTVTVATPCKESWSKMQGDERVRFCGRCEKNVFNLSAMTAPEAEALLRERGEEMCIRFFRRPDGTVLTSDCPVGASRRRRRRMVVTAVAAVAGALGVTWALLPKEEAQTRTAGCELRARPPEPPPVGTMGGSAYMPPPPPPEPAPPPHPEHHPRMGKVALPRH